MTMNPVQFLHQRNSGPAALGRLKKHGFSPQTLAALDDFVSSAADHELYQISPCYIAERLGLDEQTTLTLLIAGVTEGLFSLNWEVTCPLCEYRGRPTSSLAHVVHAHCETCGHNFNAQLDDEIWVTVTVNDLVRQLSPEHFDSAEFQAWARTRYGSVPALALINIPLFREAVAPRTLPEGQFLGVKGLAIFFSDLRQSTAFYHKFGDGAAYQIVRQHFEAVFEAVARHNGAAIKTIGDGIMGVFTDSGGALRGIAAAQAAIRRLSDEAGLKGEDRLALKVGLHVGPCIVVILNKRLDYFGQAVNIAARLSTLAQGDDLVMSHAVLNDTALCVLAESMGQLQPLDASLRGLPDQFELHRLAFAPLAPASQHSLPALPQDQAQTALTAAWSV